MNYSTDQFERLFKNHYRIMYRLAYSITENEEDSKDAVHQVFTELWHKKPIIKDGTEKSYLLTATRNQSIHILQKIKRKREYEQNITISEYEQQDSEHQELISELRKIIKTSLTSQDQKILQLHYDENMTYNETAKTLGISSSAVNKHISRSLYKIRNLLKLSAK